jgi:anti-sigma factor RsiW
MTSDARPPDTRLDRLLDGSLTAAELAAIERDLARDPALRVELDELRDVDASLRRLFAPDAGALASPPAHTFNRRPFLLAAVAAAIAILAVGSWWFLRPVDAAWAPAMFALYRAQESAGFVPEQVCTTRAQFMLWTAQTFQHTLAPADPAPGIQWVGWNRDTSFSTYTGILLTRVDGAPVVVVLDPNAPSRVPASGLRDGNLRIFARRINGVGAIEITPLDHPRVIDAITPG